MMTSPDGERSASARLRVLIPLDGSDLAAQALPVAEHICSALAGDLHVVTVLTPVIAPFVVSGAYVPADVFRDLTDEQERNANDYLARVVTEASAHGLAGHVIIHLEHGDAAPTLLDAIAQIQPTLVVMTTHGRTGIARFTLGSVADRIVRSGVTPVLLLHSFPTSPTSPSERERLGRPTEATSASAARVAPPHLAHALAPLDGSAAAEAPLFSIARQLAGPVLHAIILLRVVDPREGEQGQAEAETYLEDVRSRLRTALEGRNCAVTTCVEMSRSPAQRIVARAQSESCDVIVMATQGAAGLGRLAFGGVTDHVLQDGRVPLLLMRPPRQ